MIFRLFSAVYGFYLHGNLILSSDLNFSLNFTSIIVVSIFFHFCIIEETQDAKMPKNPCLGKQGHTPLRRTNFCILFFLDYTKVKKNYKNIYTTIIDMKFDEESKSDLKIGLNCKGKPENAENCWKNHKIACRKKRCGKIPSLPIIIRKSIKKINFWRLLHVSKHASVLVITVFLFSGFSNFHLFL